MSNTGICTVCGCEVDLDTISHQLDDFGYWNGICDECEMAYKESGEQLTLSREARYE